LKRDDGPSNEMSRRLLAKLGFRSTHGEFYEPTGPRRPSYPLSGEEFRGQRRG